MDPRWQEAMRKRGVTDFSLAVIDAWPCVYLGPEDDAGRRLARPLTFLRSKPGEHHYARPIEGLLALVDLDTMEVLEITDHGVVPVPEHPGNYIPELMFEEGNRPRFERLRADVKPLAITQPDGPSFKVDGRAVEWQKWRFRVGWTLREGLVLFDLRYEDRGELRPILYRASLSEVAVPYGSPQPTHVLKCAFDESEYGLGLLTNALEPGCDCLGEIHYFDGLINDQDGNALPLPNAICMHEEDVGIAWKHFDHRAQTVEVRTNAPTRPFLDRQRRQLRVRLLLVPLPGREHRVRGQANGRAFDRRLPCRRGTTSRRCRLARPVRPQPPAFLLRTTGHGRRRAGKHRRRGQQRGQPARAGQPVRQCLARESDATTQRSPGPA